MDVELVLTFFDFHLSVIFITLGSNYDTSVDLNSVRILYVPFCRTRPSPLLKIGGNAFGAHFLQLFRKRRYGDPHFSLYNFNKNSASF